MPMDVNRTLDRCLALLDRWVDWADRHWHEPGGADGAGCFGTGYEGWGTQTTQKYVAAVAALAQRGKGLSDSRREHLLERALAGLRFNLRSHRSHGHDPLTCCDGRKWGRTWISQLGIERMMHGAILLEPRLTDADRAALRRVLSDEARWIVASYERHGHRGIQADRWNHSGRNNPESNLWVGALLWRTAAMYPDDPEAERWREEASRWLVNAVSVPSDAGDDRVVDGRPIRDRHLGANFFPNYALDHHGYHNVGYQVICVSNAAMLHFDARLARLATPESLHHHQSELWSVLRRTIFGDGRLARIGGDTRVRYAYCQDYLLPSLLYAADRLADPHAPGLLQAQLDLIEREADYSGDGSFYGKRLAALARSDPLYFTRLESDRAVALSMTIAYLPLVGSSGEPSTASIEPSLAGGWCEPEYGSVLHRSPERLASFAWRAKGLAQGLCLPPGDGHLAEWNHNLGGVVRFCGDAGHPGDAASRRLIWGMVTPTDGGFTAIGSLIEGARVSLGEGWSMDDIATHHIAVFALPDGRSMIGMNLCRMSDRRAFVASIRGLHLNIPNDLYNDHRRAVTTAMGEVALTSPPTADQWLPLGSRWACVDGRLGVVGLDGADGLVVSRSPRRRGGRLESLYVEELCWPGCPGPIDGRPGATLLDAAWLVAASVDAEQTRRLAGANHASGIERPGGDRRAIEVIGADGKRYRLIADWESRSATMLAVGS